MDEFYACKEQLLTMGFQIMEIEKIHGKKEEAYTINSMGHGTCTGLQRPSVN